MAAYSVSSFSVGEILSKAWTVLKENPKEILLGGLLMMLATQIPSYIVAAILGESSLMPLANLAIQIWSVYVSLGFTRYMLGVIRGQHPSFELIFNNTPDFVKFLIMYIRYTLVVIGGTILFIIPGIYFAIKYMYVLMLVADNKADGAEAFKMSARMTSGNMLNLIVYGVVVGVMFFIGLLLLAVPGIVAAIVGGIGSFLIYEYLLKKTK